MPTVWLRRAARAVCLSWSLFDFVRSGKGFAGIHSATDTFYEWPEYQFRSWSRGDVHVLLSLDAASVDLTQPGVHRADRDFALAWTRTFGRGRVFYTALGHEPAVWQDARFQQHLLGGIRWAMGDL